MQVDDGASKNAVSVRSISPSEYEATIESRAIRAHRRASRVVGAIAHDGATFLRAYINGSIVGKGRGQSEPQVNIRDRERLTLVPLRSRPGRRPRCGPLLAKDRI